LKLVITVDIDNDGVSTADERNHLSWSSVDVAPTVREVLAQFGFCATWFLRADWQLQEVYGTCDYLLRKHAAIWNAFLAAGDELAWHPHLYTRNPQGRFVPEREGSRAAEQFRQINTSLIAAHHAFQVVRIGEAFGSNELAGAMEDLGLRVDSTAISGRRRDDLSRSFDWSVSPNRPFRPSVADFRIPGHPSRGFWQVPMTTVPIRAPRENAPVPRYLNLAYRPEVFAEALKSWKREDVLVTILHIDELLPHAEPHPFYEFDFRALPINLARLAEFGATSLTMTQLADQLDEQPRDG
jgi:hypothetical protein